MSANDETTQEATRLFIFQLKTRPENVVANCNALLDGSDFKIELVPTIRQPSNPQEASLFDFKEPSFAMETAGKEVATV